MSVNLAVGQPDQKDADNSRRTPLEFIEVVRSVLMDIDLDPASDQVANENVRAKSIFTIEDDGLKHDWAGQVFLNPPGGRLDPYTLQPTKSPVKAVSSVALWWAKLIYELQSGRVTEAVFIAFSLEALMTTQKFAPNLPVTAFPFCVPSKRYNYQASADAKNGSPPGASAIVYLGNNQPLFEAEARKLGFVSRGLTATEARNAPIGI
jgi:hypothetical protein